MAKRRTETWLALIVLAIGLVVVGVLGRLVYVAATPPLHPDPEQVPSAAHADPQPAWNDPVTRARGLVRASLNERSLPGLSVAVGVGGELVWAEGFGWANVESQAAVTPDTRFRLGTASTVLTSAAAGLLIEDGRLTLDEKIQTYVPEYPEQDWPVTVRQLMAHTAGLVHGAGDEGPLYGQHCDRPAEALQFISGRQSGLRFQPGTAFAYSSYGWLLMSAAIETAAKQPFLTFMRQRVFEPLGMRDTVPDSETMAIPNRATFYFPRFAADPRYGLHGFRTVDYSCYAGASVFLSTPSDLVRFAMAINAGTLLEPATVQAMQRSQRLPSGEETGYGLGWDVETVTLAGLQTRTVGHDGDSLGGMVTSLLTVPDRGIAVAVMSNISYADTAAVALQVADAFAQSRSQPAPK